MNYVLVTLEIVQMHWNVPGDGRIAKFHKLNKTFRNEPGQFAKQKRRV